MQPRSGAGNWDKEDLKDDVFLYQHKEMLTAQSHTVSRHALEDLRCNAIDDNRRPCYVIEYEGIQWFVVDANTFHILKETL